MKSMTVREFLGNYRNRSVFFPPIADEQGNLVGNHGDHLIELGTRVVFRHLQLRLVSNPNQADLIVLDGGGHMLEMFGAGPRLFRELSRKWPNIPLCALPGSYHYPTRSFAEEVGDRHAPVVLFCRERYSFEHLTVDHRLPPFCSIQLDHDMAFELAGDPLVKAVATGHPKHVLIVERRDSEHPSIGLDPRRISTARRMVNKLIPHRFKKPLYPLVKAIRARQQTPFRKKCEQLLATSYSDFVDLPRLVHDISLPYQGEDFQYFCRAIGEAAIVFTTRLHVGILAAMAGKPTFIFDGAYHKIKGIYEYSLAQMPHVTFVRSDE